MNDMLRVILIAVEYLAWVGVFGYGVAVLVLGTVKPEEGKDDDPSRGAGYIWGWFLLLGVDLLLGAGGLLAGGVLLLLFLLNVAANLPDTLKRAVRHLKWAVRHPEVRWAAKMAGCCLAVVVVAHWTRVLLL